LLLPSSCRYCSHPPAKQESKESSSSILINRLSTGFPSQQSVKGHFCLGLRLLPTFPVTKLNIMCQSKPPDSSLPRPIKCISRPNLFPLRSISSDGIAEFPTLFEMLTVRAFWLKNAHSEGKVSCEPKQAVYSSGSNATDERSSDNPMHRNRRVGDLKGQGAGRDSGCNGRWNFGF
jgi:hypothetical protein